MKNNDNDIEYTFSRSTETSSLRPVCSEVSIASGEGKVEEVATNNNNNTRHPRSKRFMVLSATTAAAVMALTYRSSGGTVTSLLSSSSALVSTRTSRKQGESCGGILNWDGSCDDNLSCYTGGRTDGGRNSHYCVPNGQEFACCPDGIDCLSGFDCGLSNPGFVNTCNSNAPGSASQPQYYAKPGSCHVNTGKPSTEIVVGDDDDGAG